MFRCLMKQAQKLPEKERIDALSEIRAGFLSNRNLTDSEAIKSLMTKAESSLGYLKMITPKRRGQSESYRKVFGESSDPLNKKAVTNWHVRSTFQDHDQYEFVFIIMTFLSTREEIWTRILLLDITHP